MWEQALVSAEGNNCVANRMGDKMVIDRVKIWRRADVGRELGKWNCVQ